MVTKHPYILMIFFLALTLLTSSCGGGSSSSDTTNTTTTPNTYYKDVDGDGYSDGTSEEAVTSSADYYLATALTAITGDCDDTDPAINPGAIEICGDAIDQNCDGASELDSDGDATCNTEDACPYDPSIDCSMYGPLVIGEECVVADQCTSRLCEDDGTGTLRCQEINGCRPKQELCELDTDCCSGSCILFPGTSLGRCEDPPGCLDSGELCGYAASNDCCIGNTACGPLREIISGRCYSTSPYSFLDSGATCTFDEECVSGVCVYSAGVRNCQ